MRFDNRFNTEAPMPLVGNGVWDAVDQSWVAENLAGDAASWHAAILNLRYTESGDRPDDGAWFREAPPYVELRITASRTEVARLHMWVRESDGLHGFVTYMERPARDGGRWVSARYLRQLSADEIEQFAVRQAARRPFGLPG